VVSKKQRQLLPFAIAALIIGADRASKIYIRNHFDDLDFVQVIPGWVRIIHTENPGAAFGILADGHPILRVVVLVGISLAVLIFIANALWKLAAGLNGELVRLGLGLILGGAAGNLYDRVLRGTVTDFLEVYQGTWSFPAFNVADSAITVGAVLMLVDLLRPRRRRAPELMSPSKG
jgi:signal peptidase II